MLCWGGCAGDFCVLLLCILLSNFRGSSYAIYSVYIYMQKKCCVDKIAINYHLISVYAHSVGVTSLTHG